MGLRPPPKKFLGGQKMCIILNHEKKEYPKFLFLGYSFQLGVKCGKNFKSLLKRHFFQFGKIFRIGNLISLLGGKFFI